MLKKFVDPLPIMKTMRPAGCLHGVPYFEVTMKQTFQKLHRDLPPTKVWGYNGQYPGPTFHVWKHQPIHVLWKNELPERHFLPIDTTVHGAEKSQPEVRTVVHLHGGVTPDTSDGYPEAWFTRHFKKAGPYFSHRMYTYPNHQDAANLWYHDHAMGITRLNIYAGLSGMYIVHDENEARLNLPCGPFDLPLIIQDRSFRADGSLFYPSRPAQPQTAPTPSVIPDFYGDTILVNGKVWPYLNVEPRKYRFRMLNGSNARIYRFSLSNGAPFIQIGTDQGLLETPVRVPALVLAPAERADVIIDFSTCYGKTIILENNFETKGEKADPETTGTIMQFRVNENLSCGDHSSIPGWLAPVPKFTHVDRTRTLKLSMRKDSYGRNIHLLDDHLWSDPVTEVPKLGQTEVWSIVNETEAIHPIHLHLVRFQILDRQPFDVDVFKQEGKIILTGPRAAPDLNERGWKDTVRSRPGEVTRIMMRFGPYPGLFVWHCHILEHEDYEMMRPYFIQT
ncbi:multicopper oxidase family protein [Halobacillus kuroshimensis]|uniref:multicopper oxidase family protein n=1 Tax=Halobacillus kuroshimensis TaxID=302481 RepID=UPI0003F855FB|nr:multicopper oxidase [Halobacillus kuroshimensis]